MKEVLEKIVFKRVTQAELDQAGSMAELWEKSDGGKAAADAKPNIKGLLQAKLAKAKRIQGQESNNGGDSNGCNKI